ncbi:hypothetical protein [Mesorhizobium sp. ZC-5]|uniref:hypothetical protein n=1 Tax=Mesorhizobium sp. ZC-5 TaxID=2986066 RepID=UPI0021E71A75|nr:hypothetical protein [Mesorhizobium sp. ZC-5]MCV3239466.1 hypothetical protein [Mesorhizobium sp. ZC-5]
MKEIQSALASAIIAIERAESQAGSWINRFKRQISDAMQYVIRQRSMEFFFSLADRTRIVPRILAVL